MAINFPSNPSNLQVYPEVPTEGVPQFYWQSDKQAWARVVKAIEPEVVPTTVIGGVDSYFTNNIIPLTNIRADEGNYVDSVSIGFVFMCAFPYNVNVKGIQIETSITRETSIDSIVSYALKVWKPSMSYKSPYIKTLNAAIPTVLSTSPDVEFGAEIGVYGTTGITSAKFNAALIPNYGDLAGSPLTGLINVGNVALDPQTLGVVALTELSLPTGKVVSDLLFQSAGSEVYANGAECVTTTDFSGTSPNVSVSIDVQRDSEVTPTNLIIQQKPSSIPDNSYLFEAYTPYLFYLTASESEGGATIHIGHDSRGTLGVEAQNFLKFNCRSAATSGSPHTPEDYRSLRVDDIDYSLTEGSSDFPRLCLEI